MSHLPPQLQQALLDPQATIVTFGPRSSLARQLVRLISSAALYSSIGAGVFLGGTHMAEISGLAGEIQARRNSMQVLGQSPQGVSWVSMPTSPFLQVGFDQDGNFSADRLVNAYRAAGLSASQALDVSNRLSALYPVLMGVNDAALVKSVQHDAQQAAQDLARTYPEQEASLRQMIQRGHVPAGQRQPTGELPPWEDENIWSQTLEQLQSAGHEDLPSGHQVAFDDMAMPEARGALEDAVAETGLRALRVPAAAWSSPQRVFDLAQGLKYANMDLQEATQWSDQVLGLGGRVVLTIGKPPSESGAAGLALANADGRVQVWAQWDNLSHEWFHAVDYISAQQSLQVPGLNSLSNQLQPLRVKKHPGVVEGWKASVSDMFATTPQWQHARLQHTQALDREWEKTPRQGSETLAASVRPSQYWNSTVEQMAYAFQATQGARPGSVFELHADAYNSPGIPGMDEAMALEPVWVGLFEALKPLNLSTPSKPSTMEERASARRMGKIQPAPESPGRLAL